MFRHDDRVFGMQGKANSLTLGGQASLASAIGRDAYIYLTCTVVLNDNQYAVALIDDVVDMAG
jgi:hypothetical protein